MLINKIAHYIGLFLFAFASFLQGQIITPFAGTGTSGYNSDNIPAVSAQLNLPRGVALDSFGNVYIADRINNRIRVVAAQTGTLFGLAVTQGNIYTIAGNGGSGFSGDGGIASAAQLSLPTSVAIDQQGNLYIADTANERIRFVAAQNGNFFGQSMNLGYIYTIAGNGNNNFSGDGGAATAAEISSPNGVAADFFGNFYIADTGNSRIRFIDAAGIISTVAGSNSSGFGGDGGLATLALLNFPTGVAVDQAGNLFIADRDNQRIRYVNKSTGIISTIAGSNNAGGFGGDGGAATSAQLDSPYAVTIDSLNNIYIADTNNHRIRFVSAHTGIFFGQPMTAGNIYTIAGNGMNGNNGNGGLATLAELNFPRGIATLFFGPSNFYIGDTNNSLVRLVETGPPTISGISPTSGPSIGGTNVTITGTNFDSNAEVKFGLANATNFTVNSSTQIVAVSPPGSGIQHASVTTPFGASSPSSLDEFTYILPPTVTGISPTFGSSLGGTNVTINGTDFALGATVLFGSNPATNVTVNSSNQIIATSPAGNGIVDVIVSVNGQASTASSADQFTYFGVPTISGISPNRGLAEGGTSVTLTGTGFAPNATVQFGSVAAPNVTVISSTQMIAISPAGSGIVDITVTTPFGKSATSAADQFTYFQLPVVTNIFPKEGTANGGNEITITGIGFTPNAAVQFGGVAATNVRFVSSTEIVATSPAGNGIVNITVTTPFGTSATSAADQFTYLQNPVFPIPEVTNIFPKEGPANGGNMVTIIGANFQPGAIVHFGMQASPDVRVISATQIMAIVPAGTGTVDITITTSAGTSLTSAVDQYTDIPLTLIFPPSHLKGFQTTNRFASQTDYINVLTWNPPIKGNSPVAYKIYRVGRQNHLKYIGKVSSHHKLYFEDHNRKKKKSYSYQVVSIDSSGQVSEPAIVEIEG